MTANILPKSTGEAIAEISARLYKVEQRSAAPNAGAPQNPNPSVDTITVDGIVVGSTASPASGLILTAGAHMEDIWIDASWTAPADGTAANYDVELCRKVGASYELVQNYRTGTGTSIRMAGLEPTQTYGVRVIAINRIGVRATPTPATGFSDVTTGLDATIPGQVTGVIATSMLRGFMLSWDEVVDRDVARGSGQYQYQWSLGPGGDSLVGDEFTTATVVSIPINSYSNFTFYFRVRAIDNSGNAGAWSADASSVMGRVVTNDLSDTSVITAKLANSSVSTVKLADLAVEASKLADSSVTTTKIANLAVGSAAIQALAVGTAHIADASIITAKIGDLEVTTAKIADLSVTTAKIENLAVDNAKIADLDAAKITAGTINADRIAANSLDVNKLTTSTLTSKTITIGAGGVLKIGDAPTTGILINDQGIRLYSGGVAKVVLDVAGTASFEGNISASTITSSTLTSATINSGTITGTTVRTAASGQRIAMEAGAINALFLYSGNVNESQPGRIAVAISGSTLICQIDAPRTSGNDYTLMTFGTVTGGNGANCNLILSSSAGTQRAFLQLGATSNLAVPTMYVQGISTFTLTFGGGSNTQLGLRGSGNYAFIYFYGNGTEATINVNNGLGAGIHIMNGTNATFQPIQASAFNVSSSEKTKRDIKDAGSALDKLQGLRVAQYKRNRPERTKEEEHKDFGGPKVEGRKDVLEPEHILASYDKEEVGLIAEQMLEVIPAAVVMGEDGPTGYNLAYVVAMLVKAVQELNGRIPGRG